jgi:hypothetical protein
MIGDPWPGCYPARHLGRARQRGVTPRARTDMVVEASEKIIKQMQEKISLCDCVCPAWQRRLIDIY